MKKIILTLIALLVLFLPSVSAQHFEITEVQLEGTPLDPAAPVEIKPGTYDFRVSLNQIHTADMDDVEVIVNLTSDQVEDHYDDQSDLFLAKAGTTYVKHLTVELPLDIEQQDYTTTVTVRGKDENDQTQQVESTYTLNLNKWNHELRIDSVELAPVSTCAEQASYDITISNIGENSEVDVQINTTITGSDVEQTHLVSQIDVATQVTETVQIDLPADKELGQLEVNVSVFYDGSDDVVQTTTQLDVDTQCIKQGSDASLTFESVKATIAGFEQTLQDGDDITTEVEPGTQIDFQIEVKNQYVSESTIDNVNVNITIKNIDNGNNIVENHNIDFLNTNQKQTATLPFIIPVEVQEGQYDIIIETEGKDNLGNIQKQTQNSKITVAKQAVDVRLTQAALQSTQLTCDLSTSLDVKVLNAGTADQQANLTINITELELSFFERFTVKAGAFTTDNVYSNSFAITLPESAALQTYEVNVTLRYGQGEEEKRTLSLTRAQCDTSGSTPNSKLGVKEIEVDVDGDSDEVQAGDRINDEAKPGSIIEFTVEALNLFDNDTEIEDVEILVAIEDIDDGRDIDEESDSFDLDGGDDNTEKLRFTVPYDVDEGDYTVVITLTGRDTYGDFHKTVQRLTLEVEKDNHHIMMRSNSLSLSQLSCNRNTELRVGLSNLGKNDEDVRVVAENSALGLVLSRETEIDESDTETIALPFTVDHSTRSGTYPINIKVFYDDEDKIETSVLSLQVADCVATTPVAEQVQQAQQTSQLFVNGQERTQQAVAPAPQAQKIVSPDSLFDNIWVVGSLFAVELMLIMCAVVFIIVRLY